MSTQELVPLVITTAKNGVFFGYGVVPEGPRPESLKLERARSCRLVAGNLVFLVWRY
jgi:hypothetical protein